MRRRINLTVAALAVCITAGAQSAGQSFDDFRKGLLQRYNDFRSDVLENYDRYLEGVWKDYQQFKAFERDTVPKPAKVPELTAPPADPPSVLPAPVPVSIPEPAPAPSPPATPQPSSKHVPRPKPTPVPLPAPPKAPIVENKPVAPSFPAPGTSGGKRFDFFGMAVDLPAVQVSLPTVPRNHADYAAAWRAIDQSDIKSTLIPALEAKAAEFSLNDYLKYELAQAYVEGVLPDIRGNASVALLHYMLANMGYDVRLGINARDEAVLLVPFIQDMVYGRTYLEIDGRRYFMFLSKDVAAGSPVSMRISTCELPADARGNKLDLHVGPLSLPYEPQSYHLSAAGLEISGEFNGNILKLLYRYPQMPMGEFARSSVLPDTRAEIVDQLKPQLEGKPTLVAVNTLLHFVQGAFEYSTDGAFHGFEKPYFFEETLYYPKCDCEDRAIFFTYLLWHVLGVENQLLSFPGHESAAVYLPDVAGDSYEYDGKRYVISDPTYIGSSVGMCMPRYKTVSPGVDHTYAP